MVNYYTSIILLDYDISISRYYDIIISFLQYLRSPMVELTLTNNKLLR